MKAAVLHAFGQPLSIESIDVPELGPDDVLVKVMACGVDGTDLKMLDGFGYRAELPFVMGHEVAGIVERAGSNVRNTQPGDRVTTYNFVTCGECRNCRSGRTQLCPNITGIIGVKDIPGGYAEYLRVPASQVVQLPDGIDWADAAVLSDAGITAYHSVQRSRVNGEETVAIVGAGGVGSFAVQFARLTGARVISVERTQEKCRHAAELGAHEAINGTAADVAAEVRRLTDGWGADCVIDIVGTEETITNGIDSLANGGRFVLVGYTPDTWTLEGKRMAQNEIEFIGTRCGGREDLLGAAKLLAEGKARSIVTDRFPLESVNDAHKKLRSGEVMGRLVLMIG